MATDPRISLAAQPIDLANLFAKNQAVEQGRALINQQREQAPFQNQLLQLQTELAQAQQPGQLQVAEEAASPLAQLNRRDKARLQSVVQGAQELSPLLESNDVAGARSQLIARKARLEKLNLPTETTDESIELLDANPDLLRQRTAQAITLGQQAGFIQRPAGAASTRAFAPVVDPVTGELGIPTFDPATQRAGFQTVPGAPRQQTEEQRRGAEITERQRISDIAVSETRKKETIKQRVSRTSALKKEFSEKNRTAARAKIKIAEAQKLVSVAKQGLGGQAKIALARVFPGIDAGNEAALVGAFKSLALDELQKFSGPTTDFEFTVTEDIAGSLGQGKSANIARLASLERATWFAQRESKQFNEHVKAGHDPDQFGFNFNELVTPKKGGPSFALRDLQETAVFNHISIDEVIKRLSR